MRNFFVELLINWAKEDKNIYLLTADLGFSVLEPFAEAFPQRYINVGIAEQNMIGIAAGLALRGKRVFVYSIVNFGTLRCLEQIRNDICYHNANVVVTIVGAGLAYGTNGYTHLGVEDLAVMLPLPNMQVFSPADKFELAACMEYIQKHPGPSYLRLAKGNEQLVHSQAISIENDLFLPGAFAINIICHGTIVTEAIKTKHLLTQNYNIDIGVYCVPLLKPFPNEKCLGILSQSTHVFLVEEHMQWGGMNAMISALAASLGPHAPYIYTYQVDERVLHLVGNESFLRCALGLDAQSLTAAIYSKLALISSQSAEKTIS